LGLASTTTYANIDALLSNTLGAGALQRFAVIGAGDQVSRKKPAPDIYEHVLRELQASPDECVAIEDSSHGLSAAKAAGLYTIVTPSDWTAAEDFRPRICCCPHWDRWDCGTFTITSAHRAFI
jgi:beta-phosphoglucomutase-like phosphatase (HAD superfamily)